MAWSCTKQAEVLCAGEAERALKSAQRGSPLQWPKPPNGPRQPHRNFLDFVQVLRKSLKTSQIIDNTPNIANALFFLRSCGVQIFILYRRKEVDQGRIVVAINSVGYSSQPKSTSSLTLQSVSTISENNPTSTNFSNSSLGPFRIIRNSGMSKSKAQLQIFKDVLRDVVPSCSGSPDCAQKVLVPAEGRGYQNIDHTWVDHVSSTSLLG